MAKAIKNNPKVNSESASKNSFLIKDILSHKLRYIALMDKTSQTEILNNLLTKFTEDWEKKNGKIPSSKN